MGLFWKRKSKDQFVTLGLNEPAETTQRESPGALAPPESAPVIQPTPGPDPEPSETARVARYQPVKDQVVSQKAVAAEVRTQPKPTHVRSPFQTSVLGLDLTIEELQAQEAALEQEFSARFRRAVAATRESLSEKLDSVFAGARQIDAALLDELEEALIAADIGVPTTMHVLESVRRGISRKEIDDIEKLKQSIKSELLSILQASEKNGVASEATVP